MSEVKELLTYDLSNIIVFLCLLIVGFDKIASIICKWFPMLGETRSMREKREMRNDLLHQQEQIDKLFTFESDTHNDVKLIKTMLERHIETDNERTISSFRSTLYRLHKEFTEQGYVTPEGLKVFNEVGNAYVSAGGDDIYHSKLEPEVLSLKIEYDENVL